MKQFLLFLTVIIPFSVFSQLHETFKGALITTDNPWVGNIDQFQINQKEELTFVSPQGIAGESSISVPYRLNENMTWDIDVKLDFKSTTSNNARIVIYETSKITYYIQIGNNAGEISLYSMEKGSSKVCIKGRSLLLSEPYTYVSIRLTLENSSNWTLYTCKIGETAFTQEGTYSKLVDNIGDGGVLKLLCRYIQGRVSYYYFDNIHVVSSIIPLPEVKPIIPDQPLNVSLLEILPLKNNQVQFVFDNPVDFKDASFSVSEIGMAENVMFGENTTIVVARFARPLLVNKEYVISYRNLKDLSGRVLEEESWTVILEDDEDVEIVNPDTTQVFVKGILLINEVMADPKGLKELPETEYVELFNTSNVALSLDGWRFLYDSKEVLLDGFVIPAKGYAVLFRAGRDVLIGKNAQPIPLSKFPSALANTGKLLQLKDLSGKLIDEVSYPKAISAKSWERLPDGDWHLSSDSKGGTPGEKNSPLKAADDEEETEEEQEGESEETQKPELAEVQPQEIVFNELLPNPYAGGSEYIELYNRSNRRVSLKGLSIATRKTDGALNTNYSLASIESVLEVGGYALLTKDKDLVSTYYLVASPQNMHQLKLPVLANTSSTLVLFRASDKVVIDEIAYSNKWHSSSVKDEKGVALERVNPDAKTQDPHNWISAASTAGYGTPGYKNSQNNSQKDEVGLINIEVPKLNEGGMYGIKYYLDNFGYNCKAFVFNVAGVRVAEIINNELLGAAGEISWDGCGFNGRPLNTGVYIFYVELYSANGVTKQYKKAFLIH